MTKNRQCVYVWGWCGVGVRAGCVRGVCMGVCVGGCGGVGVWGGGVGVCVCVCVIPALSQMGFIEEQWLRLSVLDWVL